MKLAKGVVFTQTDEGTFLLDTRRGKYWHLNDSGMSVLQALLKEEPFEKVVTQIASDNNVEPAIFLEDCQAMIKDLRSARLIKGSP